MDKTYQINISGRVQGVGFRPFIFNLAQQFHLKGFVSNDENGVIIQVQGNAIKINQFFFSIEKEKPTHAIIQKAILSEIIQAELFNDFSIKPTGKDISPNNPLTPDFATCPSCEAEIFDPKNRRYFYPFTTCTQCGPRYAVTKKFPFERENTTVSQFQMCKTCEEEYSSSDNHRFHSQTNTCPSCGITMKFTDSEGKILEGDNHKIIEAVSENLKQGKIIAVKNTSGYLLLCDATQKETVQELRKRKKRPYKPFAVLFSGIEFMEEYLFLKEIHRENFLSPESPIQILPIKDKKNLAVSEICPGMNQIGAMFPYTGLLKLISKTFQTPLIATSGNLHNSPICASEFEACEKLKNIADCFLHQDLPIEHSQDDSVIQFSKKYQQKIVLRRSRGLAPNFYFVEELKNKNPQKNQILALGSDLKNTFCVVPNRQCYISEYIGDLANYDTFLRYQKTLNSYKTIFSFQPEIILSDKHPLFESSEIKKVFSNFEEYKIQHHEAHFAAVLGEHHLWESKENVLGIIWDGIGYYSENEIWGGEFFMYQQENKKIEPIAQWGKFSWILGNKMSKTPKISALSISENHSYLKDFFDENEWKIYTPHIQKREIETSSVGRLFDAVSFILGFHKENSFEGEAAMFLEKLAQSAYEKENFKYQDYLENEKIEASIPTKKLFLSIIESLKHSTSDIIALNFHYTLIKCIEKIAVKNNVKKLAFSGGVFQNSLLIDLAIEVLKPNFTLYFHDKISSNDENISFGQLNYYLNLIKK